MSRFDETEFVAGRYYKVKAKKMQFWRPSGSVTQMPNAELQKRGFTHTVMGMFVASTKSSVTFRVSEVFQCIVARKDIVKCRLATEQEIAEGLPEYQRSDDNGIQI